MLQPCLLAVRKAECSRSEVSAERRSCPANTHLPPGIPRPLSPPCCRRGCGSAVRGRAPRGPAGFLWQRGTRAGGGAGCPAGRCARTAEPPLAEGNTARSTRLVWGRSCNQPIFVSDTYIGIYPVSKCIAVNFFCCLNKHLEIIPRPSCYTLQINLLWCHVFVHVFQR